MKIEFDRLQTPFCLMVLQIYEFNCNKYDWCRLTFILVRSKQAYSNNEDEREINSWYIQLLLARFYITCPLGKKNQII